ncbi:MAG: hypothetical protein ACI4XJ_07430 [Eubacteriales bacterium]
MKKSYKILTLILAVIMICSTFLAVVYAESGKAEDAMTFDGKKAEVIAKLYEETPYYVVVRHRQLGASHYAYTEALAEDLGRNNQDPEGSEAVFNPGSEMVLVTVIKNEDGTYRTVEEKLLESKKGVIRDPDVSADGERILFSWKQSSVDDYHLYEMTLATRTITQLTFGSGAADIEGKYLSDGSIVFNSTRDIQTVDCWKTPVSNLYKCNADGSEILRLGYDQVHTTYPTVTSDGRIIYTRWDYNDRTQMWIQAVFQMFEDGTNQTELYGNNSNFPTTLMHTREIPGESGVYLSIASGHHVYQHGKLVIINTAAGRNDKNAVNFVFNDGTSKQNDVDTFGQSGRQYKYPYALSSELYLYAAVDNYTGVDANFSIYAYDTELGREVEFIKSNNRMPSSQCVPVYTRTLFTRPSMVNYASDAGTFYVSNVYEGPSMEGIAVGTAKYLRVVELEFRSSAIGATVAWGSGSSDPFSPIAAGTGAWDIKTVLGVVPIEEDGSALFKVPANKTLYFQLLDENGCVIQTMRSWTTLMPNETFSCVGCHEDKNIAPTVSGTTTLAMKKGVQNLQPDLWMESDHDPYSDADTVGFSFLEEVQPILDESCVVCHSDTSASLSMIGVRSSSMDDLGTILAEDAVWSFSSDYSSDTFNSMSGDAEYPNTAHAPFGDGKTEPREHNTTWTSGYLKARTTFTGTYYALNESALSFSGQLCGKAKIYVNGTLVAEVENKTGGEISIPVTNEMRKAFVFGENVLSVEVEGSYFSLGLEAASSLNGEKKTFIRQYASWEYIQSANLNKTPEGWTTGEDTSDKWQTGQTPFGDRNIDGINWKTDWSGSKNAIILRREFTVDDINKFKGSPLSANITYDDGIKIYINGKEVFEDPNWVDTYVEIELAKDASDVLVEGKNIIAISLCNTAGGRQIDLSLYSYEKPEEAEEVEPLDSSVGKAQFSLEDTNIVGSRQKKYWPLSYLVLTGAYPSGSNWLATPDGDFVNFLSSMSGAEIVPPYTFGSSQSALIERLRSGHGSLTEEQIRTIECWIDLVVPAYGSYDENVTWNANEQREFDEKENKREYYDNLNKAVIDYKGGAYDSSDVVRIEFMNANGSVIGSTEGVGYAILNVEGSYSAKQSVKITLPDGQKYIAVCLNSKLGEQIVYCPSGVFEYRFPSGMGSIFPTALNDKTDVVYINNVIAARIPTEDELTEQRNLAENVYDLKNSANQFPHAETNSVADNNALQYESRCAIDGFTANQGHGTWPVQSWGPDKATMDSNYISVDFGREVQLDSLEIIIRCDFPHDTWFTGAEITLSDGTTRQINMYKTDDAMVFDMGGAKTSSIRLSGFTTAEDKWAAITEIRAFGSDIIG